MHELAISRAIVATVVRHAEGRQVTAVTVRVGHLRQVVPDTLAFSFGLVARETPCQGARLELISVPARLRCAACAREWDPRDAMFRCTCGGPGDVVAGDELQVESIDVEETACTA